jgi:hypothetical protein
MRCFVCGGRMGLVDHAPWEPQLAASGLERHTLKCEDCGDLEQRLGFGHCRVDTTALQSDLPAEPFSASPTDIGQQENTALPVEPASVALADSGQQKNAALAAEPISVSATDGGRQKDAALPTEPISVALTDSGPHKDAALPAESISVSPSDRGQQKGAITPNAFERLRQRRAALIGQRKNGALPIPPADTNPRKHAAAPNAWARAIQGSQQRHAAPESPIDRESQNDAYPLPSQPPLPPPIANSILQHRAHGRAVERLHQRQATLAEQKAAFAQQQAALARQQAAEQRVAKAAKLAMKVTERVSKATNTKSRGKTVEFDRLWDGLALPPL